MPRQLLEFGYQELFDQISWDFIHMQQHYDAIRNLGVNYEGMPEDNIVEFTTESESRPGMRHHVLIQMKNLDIALQNPRNKNIGDVVREAMGDDLALHCDCEAFLFYYQWMLLNKGAALKTTADGNPATKFQGDDIRYEPPNKTNKARRGSVCKHAANVIKVFPFWWSTIAGELQRRGYGAKPSTVKVAPQPKQVPTPPETVAPAVQEPVPQVAPEQAEVPAVFQPEPQVPQAQEPKRKKRKKRKPRKKRKSRKKAQPKPQTPQQQAYDPFDIRKRIIKNLMYPENLERTSFAQLVEAELLERVG